MFESEVHSVFRARNGELKGSGVSGSEGDTSPFRGARPKLIAYSDCQYPKPHFTHCLGGFTEPNRFPAGTIALARAKILSAKFGVGGPKLGVLEHIIIPRDKRSMVTI